MNTKMDLIFRIIIFVTFSIIFSLNPYKAVVSNGETCFQKATNLFQLSKCHFKSSRVGLFHVMSSCLSAGVQIM